MRIVLVYCQPFWCNLLLKCALQPKIAKITKTLYLWGSRFFKVIDVSTFVKFCIRTCLLDKQQVRVYLQPFLR